MKTKSQTPPVKSIAPTSKITTVSPEQAKEISAMLRAGRPPKSIQKLYPNDGISLKFDDGHDRIWQEPNSFNDRIKSLMRMPLPLRNATNGFDALLEQTLNFTVMQRGRRAGANYQHTAWDWYIGACKIGDRSASTYEAIIALLRETIQTDVNSTEAYKWFFLKIADVCSKIEELRHDLKQNPNRPTKKTYLSKMRRLQRLVQRTHLKVENYMVTDLQLSFVTHILQLSDREVLKRRKSITNTSVE